MEKIKGFIERGETVLGIELGSTRIKAVLIDGSHTPIASGVHSWENRFEYGHWTYSLDDIWTGIRDCYKNLAQEVNGKYGVALTTVGAIGVSAMMHGYMAFDGEGWLLVPFRTWRNSTTAEAAEKLSELFSYNIPQRWSIAHLYQAILNEEEHVTNLAYLTTLSGYIHWMLTGQKVLGIGDASGMFPIDVKKKDYDAVMVRQFDQLVSNRKYPWKLKELLPRVLLAGDAGGFLTEDGARLLDAGGSLKAGIPFCPPEGDAGTGMTATNSVAKRSGNVSAGTSVFAMVVLEEKLKKSYSEVDLVTTPDGSPVGMVHANNCTSDLNAWVELFGQFADCIGAEISQGRLYDTLFRKALDGDAECGGLLSYGYVSGENITGVSEGRPLFVRNAKCKFNLANFMRVHLYSALGALKIGLDILLKEENVKVDEICGHGGLFKTPGVGQKFLAAAMETPVSVMETAGEGGSWGMALLASYMINKREKESLDLYLADRVFCGKSGYKAHPSCEDLEGFKIFMERYISGLGIEREAAKSLR